MHTRKMLFTTPWMENFKWGFRLDYAGFRPTIIHKFHFYWWTPNYIYSMIPTMPRKTYCKTKVTIW